MTCLNDQFKDHPVALIPQIREKWGDRAVLEFAVYTYIPQQVGLRELFQIAAIEVTPEWFADQLAQLKTGQEIALQSRIETENGDKFHIGMLDFALTSKKFDPRPILRRHLGPLADQIEFYRSGKSFHGYVIDKFRDETHDLTAFWARALLCEEHGPRDIVDTRWIGHRLEAGYGALRWSCHTKPYKQLPYKWDFDAIPNPQPKTHHFSKKDWANHLS